MTKMLIVEDNSGLRDSYEFLFLKEGYEVDLAIDGAEALEKTKRAIYDVIVLDMIMPGTNGLDFLRQFVPANHEETKVVMFSNLQTPDLLHEALRLGVKRYLQKATVTPKEMTKVVKEILAEK